MGEEREKFLSRWSRRKLEAKSGRKPREEEAPGSLASAQPPHRAEQDVGSRSERTSNAALETKLAPETLSEDDFADVDFETLDARSDYSRFMQPGVPDTIKHKALSKLWTSDPIFSSVDPFQDYGGDFTDKAVAMPIGALRTAYKVGRGFLSDEEIAKGERLGRPSREMADKTSDEGVAWASLPVLIPGFRRRDARPEDADGLLDVVVTAIRGRGTEIYGRDVAESWMSGWESERFGGAMAAGEAYEVAVDETNGKIVAFCSVRGEEICGLFVHGGYAGRGLGQALLARAEERIRSAGLACARVTASLVGLPLYEKNGYARLAEREQMTHGGLAMRVVDLEKRFALRQTEA
jgi:GNAT superfamily N-acetyltransferase